MERHSTRAAPARRLLRAAMSGKRAAPGLLALGLLAALVRAEEPVVARVGERHITAAELELRGRRVAPRDWQALGTTWPERRRRFLEEVLVAEALLDAEAAHGEPALGSARSAALARAMILELESASGSAPPTAAEVEGYRAQQREHYEAPASVLIWRILLRDRGEAEKLLAELREPSVAEFSRLARERSLDSATAMRGGSLGFVAADGQTHRPVVRVSSSLFEAAMQVRDGELVKEPVPEGEMFAIVWRRASRPAGRPPPDASGREIAERLREQGLARRASELIARLRASELRELRPELVAELEPVFVVPAAGERGTPPPSATRIDPRPRPTDYGLR